MTFRSFFLVLLGAWLLPIAATAFEFKPAARFNTQGSYSSVPPTSSWGASGDLFLIPAMNQGDWTLLPLMAALARTTERSALEDAFFVQSYTFLAKPQLRWDRGAVTYRVYAGAKRALNKETDSELWSLGLYDYEEFGLGLGAEWKAPLKVLGQASLSIERLHRTYMNFHELGTRVVNNKNYYSKDYDGWKISFDTEGAKDAWLPWSVGYTLILKNYTDNYIVTTDGSLDLNTLRVERLHRLDTNVEGALGQHFAWSGKFGIDYNVGSQSFFETNGTYKGFNGDFYGYLAESFGASLSWYPKGPEGPSLTPAYSLTLRNYTGRLIRNPDGAFTQGLQADTEHDVSLGGRWPLLKWAALTQSTEYYSIASNQAFIARIQNTYYVFRVKLGLDLKY